MTFTDLKKRSFRGTWYSGEDLKNAACYGREGLAPYSATVKSMIGAMAMDDFENCYKCMKITNNKNKDLSVVVKIVDKCAGCVVNEAIDLTPAAFQKIAPGGDLNVGVLDISWKEVKCPNSDLYPSKPKA
ncbi:RlpA-like double-psi beta-barrel-protein domain-containing protein-containing protein [Chlamydoabsidia padenii]|nr:RlpA-like double-psi beta-barrel-protein domain-containing protein-containing protein [Chlamydoabsidia padenii]